jgi:hypothetical protein
MGGVGECVALSVPRGLGEPIVSCVAFKPTATVSGVFAAGKPTNHFVTNLECDTCHARLGCLPIAFIEKRESNWKMSKARDLPDGLE